MTQHGLKSALVAKAAMGLEPRMLPGHRAADALRTHIAAFPSGCAIALVVPGALPRMIRAVLRNGLGHHGNPLPHRWKPAPHAMRAPARWLLILCPVVASWIPMRRCCWNVVNTKQTARSRARFSNGDLSRSHACFAPAWSALIATTRTAARYARKAMRSARNATCRHVLTQPNITATQLERRAHNAFPAICLR